jgi:3-hydroxyacyl-[acyl-carrier-protein] dehydratase
VRWLWVDRFLDFEPARFARSVKNLTAGEDYFAEHFPGRPVMPATLIIEGMAQTGGFLVAQARNFREKVILGKVVRAVFHREALPGDQLIYEARLMDDIKDEGAAVVGRVLCGGELLGEIELMFVHLDKSGGWGDSPAGNFVFDVNFRQLVAISGVLPPSAQLPLSD